MSEERNDRNNTKAKKSGMAKPMEIEWQGGNTDGR